MKKIILIALASVAFVFSGSVYGQCPNGRCPAQRVVSAADEYLPTPRGNIACPNGRCPLQRTQSVEQPAVVEYAPSQAYTTYEYAPVVREYNGTCIGKCANRPILFTRLRAFFFGR